MAHDAELDRLKTAQDLTFQRKQKAHEEMQRAWDKRSSAREALNRAHEEKQRAFAAQNSAWEVYDRIKQSNGPRIDYLNSQQERSFELMKQAFDNASVAHDRRDGAAARSYADDGHRYKAESQGYVSERRRLIEEIKSARSRFNLVKPDFESSKSNFSDARQRFDAAKLDHEKAQERFVKAKVDHDTATDAFRARLNEAKKSNEKTRESNRDLARRAGIGSEHLDNIKVVRKSDGSVHIYYGGMGTPDGFGHGHATLDSSGSLTHDRKPFDANSPENFADDDAYIALQRERGHSGGYGRPHYGYIDGKPVTFALGWGNNEGHTLLSDGHVDKISFRERRNHNHYGPGNGPNDNVRSSGVFRGKGA